MKRTLKPRAIGPAKHTRVQPAMRQGTIVSDCLASMIGHAAAVTDEARDELEAHLKRRDGRFIWRLLMLLGIAILAAVWLGGYLTRTEVGGCAARGFFDVTQPRGLNPAPESPAP